MCTKPVVPARGFTPQRTMHNTGRTRSEWNIHVRLTYSTYCAVNIPCHPAERGGSMSRWHWRSTTSEGDCATVQSHPHHLRLHSHTCTHTHAHTHTHTAAQPLPTHPKQRGIPFPFHFRCCFTEVQGCRHETETGLKLNVSFVSQTNLRICIKIQTPSLRPIRTHRRDNDKIQIKCHQRELLSKKIQREITNKEAPQNPEKHHV